MENLEIQIKLELNTILRLWQDYCHLHNELFELTCDEYSCLLKSDLEVLELKLSEKEVLLANIKELENHRLLFTENFNDKFQTNISNVSDLVLFLEENNLENEKKLLIKSNLLLKSIIENIQEQNKKNQIFLTKAIKSLQDLKRGFTGKKEVPLYNSQGAMKSMLVR